MFRWKRAFAFLLCGLLLIPAAACGQPGQNPAGKYLYEKDGFGGKFIIRLNEDGTFTYDLGSLSSYIGMGTWSLEDDLICMTDGNTLGYQNYFRFNGDGELVFQEEGSTNFMHVEVAQGERFLPAAED